MVEMVSRLQLGIVAAISLGACVPPPTNRPTLSPDDRAGSPSLPPTEAPIPTPSGPGPVPSFVRPTLGPSPTFLVYDVRSGDSLNSIARLFGTTARSIAFWNRARYPSLDPDSEAYEPDRIEVGWTLLLIPTEVVDEDDLPDPTPTPRPAPSSPGVSSSPS